MLKKIALSAGLGACLFLSGCYNQPGTSLKKPGEGPANFTSGPAVGPGTTAGGSTAGPQPVVAKHGGEHASESGEAHKGAETIPPTKEETPEHTPKADNPAGNAVGGSGTAGHPVKK